MPSLAKFEDEQLRTEEREREAALALAAAAAGASALAALPYVTSQLQALAAEVGVLLLDLAHGLVDVHAQRHLSVLLHLLDRVL